MMPPPLPDTPEQIQAMLDDPVKASAFYRALKSWKVQARSSQLEPLGDWLIWAIITGRGWGKNRTANETLIQRVRSGRCRRIHLVARTAADARDTMIEGDAGILTISPKNFMPWYEPSKRRITWPNHARATLFSAEEPDALRGPAADFWIADELCTWKHLEATWSNLQLGARIGQHVQGIITTTPRPLKLLKEIMARSTTYVTRGVMEENRANLADSFVSEMTARYGGTRLGRQELGGEILDDDPNALWKRNQIDADRVLVAPEMKRIVVAVDPSCTDTGDEAGIVAGGKGVNDEYYLLDDASIQGTPHTWALKAVGAYHRWKADRIVYETNQGGQMVLLTLGTVDRSLPTRGIHASRGKIVRAEPIAALAEQHRVHHVGAFPALEDELCSYTGESGQKSPNRLDAYVYMLTELHQRAPGKIWEG